ncbi:MAG: methyltransferase domain-containing protein [Labilithrix sp.]|nr:methyltransferase domain-containing protein [Labilithrix sp.]
MTTESYVIRGGVEGFDRLKVLSRVMHAATSAALERAGLGAGMRCLDVGCGAGEVTFEIARRVGSTGRVVGVDLDDVKLDLARREAEVARLTGVELVRRDVTSLDGEGEYDFVYARFLLTHLADPLDLLTRFRRLLRPGGAVLIEDIDFAGYFCHPRRDAHDRYVELYTKAVQNRGADPLIGPRLPGLLADAAFEQVSMHIVQPMGTKGEVKLIPALTMKAIGGSVVADGLSTEEETERLVTDLFAAAEDPRTMMGLPRVFQAWGRRLA